MKPERTVKKGGTSAMSDRTALTPLVNPQTATDTCCPRAAMTDEEKIDAAAAKILEKYKDAFLELAK